MKRWRRTASAFGGGGVSPPPVVAPLMVEVKHSIPLDATLVTFDSPCTWNGVSPGTLLIDGVPTSWAAQITDRAITITDEVSGGELISWSAPDASLSPTPDPAQTIIADPP